MIFRFLDCVFRRIRIIGRGTVWDIVGNIYLEFSGEILEIYI